MSEERFHQLRAEVETLGQADVTPSHVQMHVIESAEDGSVECTSSSHVKSPVRSIASGSQPVSDDLLGPLPEEKDTPQDVGPPADHDVAMATGDDCPAEPTNIAVPNPRPKLKRNPRKSAKPVSQNL